MKKLLMAVAALGLLATEVVAQPYYDRPPPGYRPPPPPGVNPPPPPGYRPPPPSRDVGPQPGYRPAPPPQVHRAPPPVYRAPPPPVIVGPGPGYGAPPGWRHRRPYDWCQAKAQRLHDFEFRAQADGRVSRDEARIARSLRADLANSCGGGRWNPQRGWYRR